MLICYMGRPVSIASLFQRTAANILLPDIDIQIKFLLDINVLQGYDYQHSQYFRVVIYQCITSLQTFVPIFLGF
jgi:hypothetical protein